MEYIKRLSKDSEKQIIAGGLERNIKTWRKSDTEISFFYFSSYPPIFLLGLRSVWFRDCINSVAMDNFFFLVKGVGQEPLEQKEVWISSLIFLSQFCLTRRQDLVPELQPCGLELVAATTFTYVPWRRLYLQQCREFKILLLWPENRKGRLWKTVKCGNYREKKVWSEDNEKELYKKPYLHICENDFKTKCFENWPLPARTDAISR